MQSFIAQLFQYLHYPTPHDPHGNVTGKLEHTDHTMSGAQWRGAMMACKLATDKVGAVALGQKMLDLGAFVDRDCCWCLRVAVRSRMNNVKSSAAFACPS